MMLLLAYFVQHKTMPTLYEELQADTRLTFLLAERNDVVITDTFNVGRTKLVSTKIGEIRVIATLGLEAGNALLDEIYGKPYTDM